MITVKEFKDIINHCPEGWNIEFSKWEHMSEQPDGRYQGYKGWPNLCGIEVKDEHDRIDDITGRTIRKFICEDCIDGTWFNDKQECIDRFTKNLSDTDFIEFVLEVEEVPGHFDYIELEITEGDKSYSDKFMIFNCDEIK